MTAPAPARSSSHRRNRPGQRRQARARTAVVALLVAGVLPLAAVAPAAAQIDTPNPPGGTGTSGSSSSTSSTTSIPGAEETDPIELPRADVVIDDDPRVDPALSAVALDSTGYQAAIKDFLDDYARLKTIVDRHDDAVSRFNRAVGDLSDLLNARTRLQGLLNSAQRRQAKAEAHLADTREKLKSLAVDQYVHGGLSDDIESILDPGKADDVGRQRIMVESVHHDQFVDSRLTAQVRDQQTDLVTTTAAELTDVETRARTAEANRDEAAADRDRADKDRDVLLPELATRKQAIADARLTADVTGLDFTLVVFNAYVRAARQLSIEQPDCGIRWTALAGIGKTESRHGTFDDSVVDADGNETKPIYGIDLNGSNGTASIPDTDGGKYDDDPDGDRAAGPMQFIPGTWARVARDGDGDGEIDPQNYYDAALTAGVYLCRQGPGLDTDEGLRRAFRSYNNDTSYVELVLSRAHHYDRVVVPPVIAPLADDPFHIALPSTTTTKKPKSTTTTRAKTQTTR